MNFQILDWSEVKGPKQRFLTELLAKYPQLRDEVKDNDGLLHLNMSTFQRYAENLCEERKLDDLRECFEWINTFLIEGHLELLNAINVHFWSTLNIKKGYRKKNSRTQCLTLFSALILNRWNI